MTMNQELNTLRRRIKTLEARAGLVEGILDLPPDTPCPGNPSVCGRACTKTACPLANNRVRESGDLMVTLLAEIRWVHALAEEFEELTPAFHDRVRFRVRRFDIEDQIRDLEQDLAVAGTISGLSALTRQKHESLKEELASINTLLDRRSS